MEPRAAPAELRFRVLGPLEFFDGERWQPIAAAKQRLLLAALLLNANRVVPADQLVAELWGEQVPATVQTLLAGYAWRLRRTLGDPEGQALVTRPPGYSLNVRPGAIDVDEYEALLRQARADLAGGWLVGAVDRFAEALALWRGEPLADLPVTPTVRVETARLQESRLAAIETRIGIELDLGRHETILPDLRSMISQHPLRERLHAHLMVALYRAGQPVEALGAYRDLRRLLVDELGIEPSEPLRELERRVLTNDPRLLPPANPPGAAAPAPAAARPCLTGPPRRLPPDPVIFVGRAAAAARLTEALCDGGVAVVHGLAGAGKTTLAVRTAYQLAHRFPDGQVLVDMRGGSGGEPTGPLEVVTRVARVLGVPTLPDADAAPSAWQNLLAGRRVLVVLDDVATAAQVRELVPASPGSAVVLTARPALSTLDGAVPIRLGMLATGDGRALLHGHLGLDRADQPAADADAVVQLCDGLPLALRLAAARLAAHPAWSIAGFAARLAEPRARLELLAGDDLSMRASLRAAVGLLERFGQQEAISCLRRLGALDLAVVDTEAVGALLERSPVGGELVAEQLVDVGLAHALSIGCYLIPGLTRIYARELPGGDPAADAAAVRRVVEHYRAEAAGQLATLDHERSGAAGPTRAQVSAWFRRKRATLTLLAARDGTDELSKLVTQLRAAVMLAR